MYSMTERLQVSIKDQNQIMIDLLRVDVFLAAAKAQEVQKDFFDILVERAAFSPQSQPCV